MIVIRDAVSLECIRVRLTGGEPLLRVDFDDIYIFSRKQGLKVQIFTNATLIDDKRISLFTEMPPLEPIEVTLYGMRETSYGAVSRTPGSFEKAWSGIERLRKSNIPFVVRSVILPPNISEVDEMDGTSNRAACRGDVPVHVDW